MTVLYFIRLKLVQTIASLIHSLKAEVSQNRSHLLELELRLVFGLHIQRQSVQPTLVLIGTAQNSLTQHNLLHAHGSY